MGTLASFETVLLKHIIPLFGTAKRDGDDLQSPWWWPKGDGSERTHWFGYLSTEDVEAAANRQAVGGGLCWTEERMLCDLRRRPASPHKASAYSSFLGSCASSGHGRLILHLVPLGRCSSG